jgi:hypothetical protein
VDLCADGKCDTPGNKAQRDCQGSGDFDHCRAEKAAEHCDARRADAIDSSQRAYIPSAIRWACQDVPGVNTDPSDERGQEYCEYFAIILPPKKQGQTKAEPVKLGHAGQGPLALELNDKQKAALEDEAGDDDPVVGECIFTSWHVDVQAPLPICPNAGNCREIEFSANDNLPEWANKRRGLTFKMNAQNMRMKVGFNSNGAAVDLVNRCLDTPPAQNAVPAGISIKLDPGTGVSDGQASYNRGCWKAFGLFGTEWRRSDPTICSASARLFECGCGLDTNGDGKADVTNRAQIAQAVVGSKTATDANFSRGFKLGTWSGMNELPAGCRYLDTGEPTNSHTLVACGLHASDLLSASAQADPKDACRQKFANNVVVHIPIPADKVVCTPPPNGPHTNSCGRQPWVIGQEGQASGGSGQP